MNAVPREVDVAMKAGEERAPWRLADVLLVRVSRGTAPKLRVRARPLGPLSPSLLAAAAALAQARLCGRREVVIAADDAARGRWRPQSIEVDDAATVGDWLARVARPGPRLVHRADAELLVADGSESATSALRRLPGLVGALVADGDTLRVYTDATQIDDVAAECLLETVSRACEALSRQADADVGTLSLLTPCERANLLCRYQNARVRRPRGVSLVERIGQVVERWPGRVAVRDRGRELDYATVWRRAGEMAGGLRAGGVRSGEPVAVLGSRGADTVVAVLAVLRAGCPWLALDPGLPISRLRQLLTAGGARFAITVDAEPIRALGIAQSTPASLVAQSPMPLPRIDEAAPACLVATSIDAGAGVATLSHRALLRLFCDVEELAPSVPERFLHAAAPGQPLAVLEVLAPLVAGGMIVVHRHPQLTADGLADMLALERADVAALPAMQVEEILDDGPQALRALRRLIVMGPLPRARLRSLRALLPGLEVVVAYGAPEAGLIASLWQPPPALDDAQGLPIGRPLPETSLHVLAADGGLLPPGAVGEIHIGGCGVGLAGSSGRHVADPFGVSGDRLLATGELGRRLPDGHIEWIGRCDRRIDLHGDRIDPAEIEHALRTVSGCAAVVREHRLRNGERRLVAWLACAGETIDVVGVRERLASLLPPAWLPWRLIALPALPRRADGRLDVSRLPAPTDARPRLPMPYVAPLGDLETRLASAFGSVLGIAEIGRHDDFFACGGSRAQAARMLDRLARDGVLSLGLDEFLAAPTPARAARMHADRIARDRAGTGVQAVPIAIVAVAMRLPPAIRGHAPWNSPVAQAFAADAAGLGADDEGDSPAARLASLARRCFERSAHPFDDVAAATSLFLSRSAPMADAAGADLAARCAGLLGLRGAALELAGVDGLVALAMACDGLRLGHCDHALAAGIALADADGGGDSAACMLLLRRLDDAVAEAQPVLAVLRGAVVTHASGGDEVMLRRALAAAAIDAGSLGHVEAGGSDAELVALRRILARLTDTDPLGAGGFLRRVGAFGAATGPLSLLRLVLAMHEGCHPADATGTAVPWPGVAGLPRRAALLAPPAIGSRAALVIEEAPAQAVNAAGLALPQLLQVSAPTVASLRQHAGALADWLQRTPQVALADVAHSLRVGRRRGAVRATVVAADPAEAVAALRSLRIDRRAATPATPPSLLWACTGAVAGIADVAAPLYRRNGRFRGAVEACADYYLTLAGIDLRAPLLGRVQPDPQLAHPLGFTFGYALARAWIGVGLRPRAVIGGGIGDHVAAVLAGAASPRDVLRALALPEVEPVLLRVPGLPWFDGASGAPRDIAAHSPRSELPPPLAADAVLAAARALAPCCVLEIGPGTALGGELASEAFADDPDLEAITSVGAGREPWSALLAAAGALWRRGIDLDAGRFEASQPRLRVCLPVTPAIDDTRAPQPDPERLDDAIPTDQPLTDTASAMQTQQVTR